MTIEEAVERGRALFLRAFPDDHRTWKEVEAGVRAGHVFIEFSSDGQSFAILQTVKDLHVWRVGGSMPGVLELEETVSQRAAERGFDRMTALPSRDWGLALRKRGWKPEPVAPLVKELWHGQLRQEDKDDAASEDDNRPD